MTRRIGLFGGTFDPPHYGHLLAAQEVAWRLELERVLFLPTRQNPLKQGEVISPVEDRVRMVALAIADNALFELSRADLDRPPPSYTVDLLRAVREERGPDTELFFLGGADLVAELPAWHAPDEVLRLATFVAIGRPGWPAPSALVERLQAELPAARERVVALSPPGVDISSSDIRERVRLGQPLRYLLPERVAAYVRELGLYGSEGDSKSTLPS